MDDRWIDEWTDKLTAKVNASTASKLLAKCSSEDFKVLKEAVMNEAIRREKEYQQQLISTFLDAYNQLKDNCIFVNVGDITITDVAQMKFKDAFTGRIIA